MSKPYTFQEELVGKTLIRYIVGSCGFESLDDAKRWSKDNYSGQTLKIVKKTTTWEEVFDQSKEKGVKMSINAKHEAFYCDYGTSVVAVRCGSDHKVVEEFNLNDTGKFLAERMCKLLNREAAALKSKARAEVREEVVKACEDEVARFPVGGNIDTRLYLEGIIGRIRQAAVGAVPRETTLEKEVTEAKARYAKEYGRDSWKWRDEGVIFAIGNFLSSCEMLESDWDFAKREGIVAEVKWCLNRSEGRRRDEVVQ